MITQKIDQDVHEEIPRDYLPKRLDPRFDLIEADDIINQPRPKIKQTGPVLWRHIREAVAASIDSPANIPVPEALNGENGERLIFGDTRTVLPEPNDKWEENILAEAAGIFLDPVTWLDVQGAQDRKDRLNQRKDELAPGMQVAREELKDTKEEMAKAIEQQVQADADLELAEFELKQDLTLAQEMRDEHTHGMPGEIVGPPRPEIVSEPATDAIDDADDNQEML